VKRFRMSLILSFSLALIPLGCAKRGLVRGPGDAGWGVRVTWHGHSCFSFQDSVGRVFVVDPFDETVGYDLPWVDPDVVLVTHDHFDHNNLRRAVKFELLKGTGVHTLDGVEVTGVPAFHDDEEGRRHGTTNLYVWTMGGLKLAHAGDIGQAAFTPAQREALQGVDVLFLPVGGKTTVDAAGAAALAREAKPRVVVPMHYGNERVRFYEFDPVERFTALFEGAIELPDSDFQLRREDLPAEPTVYVPDVPDRKK
jgi:L-ascorbate metabolism protein UlaG (beta-lactamase superfamily)